MINKRKRKHPGSVIYREISYAIDVRGSQECFIEETGK